MYIELKSQSLCVSLYRSWYFFNFLETKIYFYKPTLQCRDEWPHRLQHLRSTNKADNISEACYTMSQSICHCPSFGIFVVWIEPLVIICGYTYLIQRNDNVFIQFKNCFKCAQVLHKSFSLRFLVSGERESITIDKNFCRFGELSKKLNNSGKNHVLNWLYFTSVADNKVDRMKAATFNPRHICWDSGPSLLFNVGKNWKKHDSFIAPAIRTLGRERTHDWTAKWELVLECPN